jgi:alkylhydroperoxidase/carboxymuconolactone decarboxylase family protein
MSAYYDDEDLSRFPEMGEDAPLLWRSYQAWHSAVFSDGALGRREKSLIALAVAHALQCPYSIDAYTEDCLEKGCNKAQMSEAIHVAAAIRSGASLFHGLQMRNAAGKLGK